MNLSDKSKRCVQRSFIDLSQKQIDDIEHMSLLASMGWSGTFGWDTLLESKRVLIISEAGAGKTYECREQQKALWEKGEAAFFLELAQLAARNFRDQLSAKEEQRFDDWLAAQSGIATFFLDSIDELKLTLGSFRAALTSLSKCLDGHLSRVRIVITTRPTPIDQQLIHELFTVPEPDELIPNGEDFAYIVTGRQRQIPQQNEDEAAPAWRNVALMPLSDEQILQMAAIRGIDTPEALLADIHARNAEIFARRPQDLIELCSDWREHRRIRTHAEQVAHDIRVKLKPRADLNEPAQLSAERALDGARRLALAALLTRKLTIRHSVEADRAGEPGTALDPEVILYDWAPKERETLLQRALFGFASYGRVRFHHRSVIEFLAAQRLNERLNQAGGIKAVKRLLFAETPQGIKVVRPTMRPVAAWLAAWQLSIFSEVRDREPNVLLDHADPQELSLPQRIDALQAYVRAFGQGAMCGMRVQQIQVHRFASPDLSDHVLGMWQAGIENPEVRELLLELIGAGPMPACADLAYGVALDATATVGERLDAISALVRLDDPRIDELARFMVSESDPWPDQLIRDAIYGLLPNHLSPERFCEAVKRVSNSERITDRFSLLPIQIAKLPFTPGYLRAVSTCLTDLIADDLRWVDKWPHFVSNYTQIIPIIAAICLRLIHAGETDASTLRSLVVTLRLQSQNHRGDQFGIKLRNAIAAFAQPQREEIFWLYDAFNESLHPQPEPSRRLFEARNDGPLTLNNAQDGEWVRRTLENPNRPLPERRMMLEVMTYDFWNGVGNPHDYINGLKRYVSDAPELIRQIDWFLAPREIDPETAERRAKLEQQQIAAEQERDKHRADWVAFWRQVAESPEEAFHPDNENKTVWSLWHAMQHAGNASRSSGWNRSFMEQYFGKETTDRLRACMMPIWRNDRPTLPHERPIEARGVTFTRWYLGLAAIVAEAEDPDWARKLSAAEAELAVRYALIDMNGLPEWLNALVDVHPVSVERTLEPELAATLDEINTTSAPGFLFQSLFYASDTIIKLFLPYLRTWLDAFTQHYHAEKFDSVARGRLERVLLILIEHGDAETQNHIKAMAEGYLNAAGKSTVIQIWIKVLMRLDPAAGIDALEKLLGPLEPEAAGAAVNAIGYLFGSNHGHLSIGLRRSEYSPTLLLRLVRLTYRYVRPSDDHPSSTFLGPRNVAQEGRNALLSALLDTKGAEAWATKLEMMDDPLFTHIKDRLFLVAREKEAEEADEAVLTESEVAAFHRYGEAPPTTRDDMFMLLVDRLDDLDDLLLRDDSPRDAWALIWEEKTMRREIARTLSNAAKGLYTVEQETVTADEKETDIRLRVAESGQQAIIELKIGEKWSGRVLRDTIKDQLVKKYMAAENSRSGCLLVTVTSNRNWKHPDTKKTLDIPRLQAMLEEEAARIVEELGGSLRLVAKVLDLRPRLKVESRT
ncbi:hypothetical protein A9404_04290 [Halothiobacillus diazotrophicus]|uniref:Uncharacterized protein n=1 Tax=Halothiobacillus diazotrophicus TaxID=1860122 RepID=A0A191ZFP0_9GAMM|nr:hypothetical protein [Halothiobacillus diazotrophicus]ANJ66699.1 hypothetical protein A9404_04290 [Halothiobacillus diazotrophicus]